MTGFGLFQVSYLPIEDIVARNIDHNPVFSGGRLHGAKMVRLQPFKDGSLCLVSGPVAGPVTIKMMQIPRGG